MSAYPARVVAIQADDVALAELSGRPRRVLLRRVKGAGGAAEAGQCVAVGDWLLVQSGIAVARLSAAEVADRVRRLEESVEADVE
ncbi:MAG TPA: HypC/HybG/HupF family hydrogenase formation chaperone [Micromonosporaceae bacterium]|jgi:hydrogenase maturation factor